MATLSSILAQKIPMDRGAWQATVHEVAKNQTWLSACAHARMHTQTHTPNQALFSRQIKRHCAEPFTEYWTCIDYSGLQLFRRCRKQQAQFDECVLDKLGWVRPDLGELSKVTWFPAGLSLPEGGERQEEVQKGSFVSSGLMWQIHADQTAQLGSDYPQPRVYSIEMRLYIDLPAWAGFLLVSSS